MNPAPPVTSARWAELFTQPQPCRRTVDDSKSCAGRGRHSGCRAFAPPVRAAAAVGIVNGASAARPVRRSRPVTETVDIAGRLVGAEQPTYVVAEIGINHNGDLDLAAQAHRRGLGCRLRRGEVPEAHGRRRLQRGRARAGHASRRSATRTVRSSGASSSARTSSARSTTTARSSGSSGSHRVGTSSRSTSWSSSIRPATRSRRRRSPTTRCCDITVRYGRPIILSTGMSDPRRDRPRG